MLERITLELSLKPFKETDETFVRNVCRNIFLQWHSFLKNRKCISIMLWCGDGSEILEYDKDLNKKFEWDRFIGTANLPLLDKDENIDRSLHERKQNYVQSPSVFTYKILKLIIHCIKDEAKIAFPNSQIRVGETFDIGPEFAISDFKYNRHSEICIGTMLDIKFGFVDATAKLYSDDKYYAAYPNGIPEGLSFGTFLGAQCSSFLTDMGFDFLWLSNGLGFSSEPWSLTGKVYDGKRFHLNRLIDTKNHVFQFWKDFRTACPDIFIETRGTNNSVGIDYATDGVPLYDLYNAKLNIMPPPNSPWTALNDKCGLELMGHMTRICNLPGNDFMFRYYLHDPWWCNSPWYDRYRESPFDIYLPMALSRIDENGYVKSANVCNILSIDNSFGNMPDSCVNESIPHLLKAEKDSPDDISNFVWLYPMHEYTLATDEQTLNEMYRGDMYISEAIDSGFPLCSVVSTDNFILHDLKIYENRIIISPVVNKQSMEKLAEFAESGGNVIIYGTSDVLQNIDKSLPFMTVNISDRNASLMSAVKEFGYDIRFVKKCPEIKNPCLCVSKNNGGEIFSIYNRNTTTDILLKYPLGAPILMNIDAELENGFAKYHFGRSEHRECRIYIKQKSGIVSAFEQAPVSGKYRRRIELSGLKNATP